MSVLESGNGATSSPGPENETTPDSQDSQDTRGRVDIGPSQGFWVLGSDDQTSEEAPKVKNRRLRLRDRPSAMEILQSVSQSPLTLPQTESGRKDDDEKKDIAKDDASPSPALEFRVASPNLTKMIEYDSDSSRVSSVKLDGLDTIADQDNEADSVGDGPTEGEDLTERGQSPADRGEAGSVASATHPLDSVTHPPIDSEDSSLPSLPDLVPETLSFPPIDDVSNTNDAVSQLDSPQIDSFIASVAAPQVVSPYKNKMRKRKRQTKLATKGKPWTRIKRRLKNKVELSKQVETGATGNEVPSESVQNENEQVDQDANNHEVEGQPSEEPPSMEPPVKTQTSSESQNPESVQKPDEESPIPSSVDTQVITVPPLKIKRSPGRPPGRKSPGRPPGKRPATPGRKSPGRPPGRSSPKGLKLRIKLDHTTKRGRGHKRRYIEDQEYTPAATSHKKVRVDDDAPKRSSARRNENDIYLDRYRYLLSSDESRSPSPAFSEATVVEPPVVECKPCRVELFDFVKCFNIKEVKSLDDLAYNKNIRRQIRALEKGHRIAMEKKLQANPASVRITPQVQASSDLVPLTALDPAITEALTPDPSGGGAFLDHLDEVLDEVVHNREKKKKKKRKKSGTDDTTTVDKTNTTGNDDQQPDKDNQPQPEPLLDRKHFKCRQCTFITADLPCIQEHINLHEEPFHCSECTATFPQISRALEHTITAHPNTPARVDRVSSFNPNDHFDEIHAVSPPRVPDEKETNYQCQLCDFRTDDRQEIESHLQSNHKTEYQYICKICDLAFCRKRETMLKHFKKWHPDQPLDFTAAPGVEDPVAAGTEKPAAADNTEKDPMEQERPTSVISIASEASLNGEEADKLADTADDVQVIEETDPPPPTTLGPESRPCTYKCLECGAKTDTFDVICAHLEVSHPNTDYNFACPFCSDYKAKTCSFVAEHIRTAHAEHSGRCMERRLENASSYVIRQYTGPPPPGGNPSRGQSVPPRTDSARSSNQENKSPDDEVMIVDVANQGDTAQRRPFQPLSLVHHSTEQTTPVQPPPVQMVQIFPDFSVTKSEFDRYQVFNLKPPTGPIVRPIRPAPPALTQPSQARPAQPRPMPTLQPRPFISTNYYPQVQNNSIQATAPTFPHLLSLMNPAVANSMAQPVLYNGVHNPSR